MSTHLTLEKLDENSKHIFLEPEIYNDKFVNYDLIKGETYYFTVKRDSYYQFSFNGPMSSPTPTITPTPSISPTSTPIPTARVGMKRGYVNDDGNINAVDFAILRMLLLGNITTDYNDFFMYRTDLNHDGKIDAIDFALLRKYLLGIIDSFDRI